ncbi:hypothetical protein MANES_10G125112v8 [Manihot esculenta]|uniref:Uncharacterized protein n=1 Tax=Manihot esculenta TaxID=3983 RepID=A0ACB7H2W8_MANES|nr:hypothetical protein MANES_10G125112v8 [Manihot esculenta]
MEQIQLFTKQLSRNDVLSALSVPSNALQYFVIPEGAHSVEFEAVDLTGFTWRFRLSTRSTGPYPKPVILQSSWHHFVEQKGLIPNDRVMFFLDHDEENGTRCRVRAQRKIMRLFGNDFWVDVQDLHFYGV